MDKELLQNTGLLDRNSSQGIEYIQNCIALYEQTLQAMGFTLSEITSQMVDNSQIVYVEPTDEKKYYADL